MKEKKVLFIGLVWPEPTSSAAGFRMMQLIETFLASSYQITFASAAAKSPYSAFLQSLGIHEQAIVLNSSSFDDFIKQLQPDIVVFDRFMVEEQYGWRVAQQCPNALRVLDTEDLHFLRQARQTSVKNKDDFSFQALFTDTAKRELAAILRSDLSLIISESEMKILIEEFRISPDILYYLPFLEKEITPSEVVQWKAFKERKNLLFIGNFIHEPNWHTVQYLKTQIWPQLRNMLPKAELHIYGAYATQKVLQLNNPKERFLIKGRAESARVTMENYRVLVAPIQFGAGVKGKFIDAMQTGTPSVTTTIGAEAMKGYLDWNGFIEDDPKTFCVKTVELYENKKIWYTAQENGIRIINERYEKRKYQADFMTNLSLLKVQIDKHRQQNFISQILLHHTMQSTKYMSLWIEEKNK
ncbi:MULTISPECIES: glycosyltransferase [unclassified Sphingobacterium]|uniref:glycosyltransferase n=1 Tax=unclassified Sphingobacterium TaxID=2609468 RepID=UPI001AE42B61|nr:MULTISPECIES: glycosyltransferase [unclassified Sphingobacterium]MDR6736787.1 glycosyltransferase involved in cell wall biosynthesis [Sphingobacterium sp. 2149]